METLAPTAPIKQVKRVCISVLLNSNVNQMSILKGSRASQNNEQASRSPAKPATLLPRPSIGKPSTILPQPTQKPVVLSNSMSNYHT